MRLKFLLSLGLILSLVLTGLAGCTPTGSTELPAAQGLRINLGSQQERYLQYADAFGKTLADTSFLGERVAHIISVGRMAVASEDVRQKPRAQPLSYDFCFGDFYFDDF